MMPRIGSLCSGYGGLDMGLTAVVVGSVAWHVENDPNPSAVLNARWPGVPNHGDIKTTDWTAVEPVEWLTAGYPCQPFSDAGLRLGEDDERHLWPYVADAIRVLRPSNILLENVRGHLKRGFGTVLGDLAALGYDARWVCIRASDAGAPHLRPRVFIAAADARSERYGPWQDGRSLGRVDRPDAGEAREWERARAIIGDRGDSAVQDADIAIRWLRADAGRRGGTPAADASVSGWGRQPDASRGTPADANRRGWEGRPERDSEPERSELDSASRDDAERLDAPSWGIYGLAIQRWERVTGRRAPRPTEPAPRGGERVSPAFAEWMMGIPRGWVTDVLPYNPALVAIGNGVVPQQAALAVSVLCHNEKKAA